ncbi:MAG TPA: glutamine-hydrolyzing carbamoyl-phosphate synthase small subunit [Gemmatimonadetes bacterium]|jgi:carbamoyl-phosphate synthase small subunit|nr:glutamine-hydrolyzing carbamoyl-phosphate synthase small subunit [Gemmatimonadota bacterium]
MVVNSEKNRAYLLLEDGKRFDGMGFGSAAISLGEVVFNTSMTGYQEILTDPSYSGQHVVMTYPMIGNYGVNTIDVESDGPKVAGFVVRELAEVYSSWRATSSVEEYLESNAIVGICEIDTRALTRHIRSEGAMRGAIASTDVSESDLLHMVLEHPVMQGLDLSMEVSTSKPYQIEASGAEQFHVVAYDCGVKANSPKLLSERGCRVTVLPADTPLNQVLALDPDGLFISNGPGDPAAVKRAEEVILGVIDRNIPIFGICLGHQLIARAFGAETYKLPFGHHGANHPVRNIDCNTVEITSQNHGFSVRLNGEKEILGAPDLKLTHVNLYDGTAEGLMHRNHPVFSVQYHPEAAPGPHDSKYLFGQFVELMERRNN